MSLDEELERAGAALRKVTVDVPAFAQLQERRHRRSVRRVTVVATLAGIAIAVVALAATHHAGSQRVATGNDSANSPTATSVVSWIGGPGVTTPQSPDRTVAPPATASPCSNADIQVTVGNPSGTPDGTTTRTFEFTNVSNNACSLSARPDVTAVLDDGTRVSATAGQPFEAAHGPEVTTTVIPVGEASLAALGFPTNCTAAIAEKAEVSFGGAPVDVSLPGLLPSADGTTLTGPGGFGLSVPTGCGLKISTFTVAVAPADGLAAAAQLQYQLRVPKSVTAGSDLVVDLVAHNPSDHDITLTPCPNYELRLSGATPDLTLPGRTKPSSAIDDRALNCSATSSLAGGETLSFELHLEVPSSFEIGTAAIEWTNTTAFQTLFGETVDVLPPCTGGEKVVHDDIGLTVAQAQARLDSSASGLLRVIWRDGDGIPSTMERIHGRVDVYVRSGVVEQACRE
jgi:hypothetical protein